MPFPAITTDKASHTFTIYCRDSDSGISTATITGSAVRVTGPSGFSKLATLISKNPASGNANTIAATYSVAGPFNSSLNGLFTVNAVAGEIADVSGNAVSGFAIDTFNCAIATALSGLASGSKVFYVLGGQSNMNGFPSTQTFTGSSPTAAQWWNGSAFVPMASGGSGGYRSWENPEIHMAKALITAYPSLQFYFASHSADGMGFLGGTGTFAAGNSDRLALIAKITNARNAMRAAGSFYYGGFVWNQGEAEAFNTTHASAFAAQLNALISEVRSLTTSALRVIVTRISSGYNKPPVSILNTVRATLDNIGAAEGVSINIDNAAIYPMSTDEDGFKRHFTGVGYKAIGDAYALAAGNFVPTLDSAPVADTTPPTVALIGTPLPDGVVNNGYSLTARITDNVGINAGSITAAAFAVKRANNSLVSKSVSISGSGLTRDALITFTPDTTGTYTIELLANQISDTSGNFAAAATLGTLTVSATASALNVDFTAAGVNALPAGFTSQNGAATFNTTDGLIFTPSPTPTDWAQSLVIGPIWNQNNVLEIYYTGHANAQGGVGVSVTPGNWLNSTNPVSLVAVRYAIYENVNKLGADYGNYINNDLYKVVFTKLNGTNVQVDIYRKVSGVYTTLHASRTSTNASFLSGARVIIDSRAQAMKIQRIVEIAPASDTTKPVAALQGTLANTTVSANGSFVVRITDNVGLSLASITASAFSVKRPNNTELPFTISSAGSATQQDVTISYVPDVTGTHTASVIGGIITDTSGNTANAVALGTFSVGAAAPDTAKPVVTLLNTPLPTATVGSPYSFSVQITDANITISSIAASAFLIKQPDGTSIAKTLSTSGTQTQQEAVISCTTAVSGTHTIELVGGQISDAAGNTADAAVLGTFASSAATGPRDWDFRASGMTALPAGWAYRPADATLSFDTVKGVSITKIGTEVRDGRCAIVGPTWNQDRPLEFYFKGYPASGANRATNGVSLDPLDWIARNTAGPPKDTLCQVRSVILWGIDNASPTTLSMNSSKDYRTTFTKEGDDVRVRVAELNSGNYNTTKIEQLVVGAAPLLTNVAIFAENREGSGFVHEVRRITN
jgi:hypothetical protein